MDCRSPDKSADCRDKDCVWPVARKQMQIAAAIHRAKIGIARFGEIGTTLIDRFLNQNREVHNCVTSIAVVLSHLPMR